MDEYLELTSQKIRRDEIKGISFAARSDNEMDLLKAAAEGQWEKVTVTITLSNGEEKHFTGDDAKKIHEHVSAGITVEMGTPETISRDVYEERKRKSHQ